MTRFVFLWWFLLPFSVSAASHRTPIGVIANQADFHEGGCELVLASDHADPYGTDRFIFMSDYNGGAVMNLNSHDIRLTLVRSMESGKEPKVGDRTRFWYTSGQISVEVDYTLSQLCPPRKRIMRGVLLQGPYPGTLTVAFEIGAS
jgi:hypothetical protein